MMIDEYLDKGSLHEELGVEGAKRFLCSFVNSNPVPVLFRTQICVPICVMQIKFSIQIPTLREFCYNIYNFDK